MTAKKRRRTPRISHARLHMSPRTQGIITIVSVVVAVTALCLQFVQTQQTELALSTDRAGVAIILQRVSFVSIETISKLPGQADRDTTFALHGTARCLLTNVGGRDITLSPSRVIGASLMTGEPLSWWVPSRSVFLPAQSERTVRFGFSMDFGLQSREDMAMLLKDIGDGGLRSICSELRITFESLNGFSAHSNDLTDMELATCRGDSIESLPVAFMALIERPHSLASTKTIDENDFTYNEWLEQ